jgi:hypothetical protein
LIHPDLVAWRYADTLMVEAAGQRRFRFSIRALMIAIALCALFLAPPIWMYRKVEEARLNMAMAEQNARLQAERALYVAQIRSAQAAFDAAKLGTANQKKTETLWAALSINHAVVKAGQTKELRIGFSLVNDGDKVIDPKIAYSHIVINGKELTDAGLILSSVAKDRRFTALAPGDSLQFSLLLGDDFKEPGSYRISWKGVDFQSPETVLRILPEEAR